MITKDFDLFDTNDCPGCKRLLMAYRYDCVRWNGAVWHTECALAEADRLLGGKIPFVNVSNAADDTQSGIAQR